MPGLSWHKNHININAFLQRIVPLKRLLFARMRRGDLMPRIAILTPTEYAAFETPPLFSSVERKRFFALSQRLERVLTTSRTPTNAICFVLTLGYFRATKRFFARQFHATDADCLTR